MHCVTAQRLTLLRSQLISFGPLLQNSALDHLPVKRNMDIDFFSGYEHSIANMILIQPAPGRNAGRMAILHVQRAAVIRTIDPEMAAFRMITAEEEASRAIFHALQRIRYPGAGKLNWQNHRQKAAVVPFLAAMGKLLKQAIGVTGAVVLHEESGKSSLRVKVSFSVSGIEHSLYCDPPFNMQAVVEGQSYLLDEEIGQVASDANCRDIEKFIVELANIRNMLLYASDQGIPHVLPMSDESMAERRTNVFSLLTLYLLIDQHRRVQPLVSQALTNFLAVLDGKYANVVDPAV